MRTFRTIEPGKRHAGHLIHWFYWADAENWAPAEIDRSDGNFVVYAALSGWRPPAAIESLARGQTVPYDLTASSPSISHNDEMSGSPGEWGTGNPGECVRYVYRDKLYAMRSGFFRYYPDETYLDFSMFRLIYKSPDRFNFIECYHPYWRSDAREWQGLNSPFQQTAQHKNTAIHIFNIPAADPWAGHGRADWRPHRDGHYDRLIQETLLRYPKSIDQKTEANGWILLREGEVYGVPEDQRLMRLARQHDRLIKLLKERELHKNVAFVEPHNEANISDSPKQRAGRPGHEEAIAFLRDRHPDILISGDMAGHHPKFVPENTQVYDNHMYAGRAVYDQLFSQTFNHPDFDPDHPRKTPLLDYLLEEHIVPHDEMMQVFQDIVPSRGTRLWLYHNFETRNDFLPGRRIRCKPVS